MNLNWLAVLKDHAGCWIVNRGVKGLPEPRSIAWVRTEARMLEE